MTKVAIVYYSGFKGVTEKIAQAVAQGARQVPETEVITIHTDSVDNHWQDLGEADAIIFGTPTYICLLYTSPSPRDRTRSRMPSSA